MIIISHTHKYNRSKRAIHVVMLWFVLIIPNTVYTTTSASDVFRPVCRMECAWELDTPLYELLSRSIAAASLFNARIEMAMSLALFALFLLQGAVYSTLMPLSVSQDYKWTPLGEHSLLLKTTCIDWMLS